MNPRKHIHKELWACTFYHYHPILEDQLTNLKRLFLQKAEQKIRGLLLISKEGVNATLTGQAQDLKNFINLIQDQTTIHIQSRWQQTPIWGFKALRVKIKKEIVNSQKPSLQIPSSNTHLDPSKWQQMMEQKKKPILLDIRNDYEVQIGSFKNAKHLNLKHFKDFSKKLKESNLPKEENILIYCTGGIRCEKALSEMQSQGFKSIKQLKGGILNYLSQFPNSYFSGNCFVFDHRVCLDQKLNPSKEYKLCPHCGQAGNKKIQCIHCKAPAVVCDSCYHQTDTYQTCSKNCRYHYAKGHRSKKRQYSSPDSFC